jgi:ELWxxDGT repeat protein
MLLLVALLANSLSGPAHLVKDINQNLSVVGVSLGESASLESVLIFETGDRLWRTDGTSVGTVVLREQTPSHLTPFNGIVAYLNQGKHGPELWRTDGTSEGTFLIRVIFPAGDGSVVSGLLPLRKQLYFWTKDKANGLWLWKSNGTPEGTTRVDRMTFSPFDDYYTPGVVIGDGIYFIDYSHQDLTKPYGLFRTDGTAAGTTLLRNFGPRFQTACPGQCFPQSPADPVELDGQAYIIAGDEISGQELWMSDGTPNGTTIVKDICPGPCSAFDFASYLFSSRGRLYFSADDGQRGKQLWTSGGTELSTVLVKVISSYSAIYGFAAAGDSVVFSALDDAHGEEPWRTDGTEGGTFLLKDIMPGFNGSSPDEFLSTGALVFLAADDGVHGKELWRSDGTVSGTFLLKDIAPGSASSGVTPLRAVGNTFYFGAAGPDGFGLWKSDGSVSGTVSVRGFDSLIASSSSPNPLIDLDGVLLFSADDGEGPPELWRSDGTEGGTLKLADVKVGAETIVSGGTLLAQVKGKFLFSGDDGSSGVVLWATDGTRAGTGILQPLFAPSSLTAVGETLFFTANSQPELWKTDGTAIGTVLVKDIDPGPTVSYAYSLTPLNGLLYFGAMTSLGPGLWRSDGTSDGTRLVQTVSVGNLVDFRGSLFFGGGAVAEGGGLWTSDGTATGTRLIKSFEGGVGVVSGGENLFVLEYVVTGARRLWRSDGTLEGTVLLHDFEQSLVSDLVFVGNRAFFSAGDRGNGIELWTSDGTPQGTTLVKDREEGNASANLAVLDGRVYFGAGDDEHGFEFWTGDGTSQGTRILKDIMPLADSSFPLGITNVGGVLLFSADDGIHGTELWRSDGTEAGTFMLQDIALGAASSSPRSFALSGSYVYFSADDGIFGRELWAMPALPVQALPGRQSAIPRVVQSRQ